MAYRKRYRRSRRPRYRRRYRRRRRAPPVRWTRKNRALLKPETKHSYSTYQGAEITSSILPTTYILNGFNTSASSADRAFDGRIAWLVGIKLRFYIQAAVYGSTPDLLSDLNNRVRVIITKEYNIAGATYSSGISVDNIIQWKYWPYPVKVLFDRTYNLDCIGQFNIVGAPFGLSHPKSINKYIRCNHKVHLRNDTPNQTDYIRPTYVLRLVSDSLIEDHPEHSTINYATYYKDV